MGLERTLCPFASAEARQAECHLVNDSVGSSNGATFSARQGVLFAVAGTFLISTNYVTAKYALKGFNTATFSLVWIFTATVYSLLIAGWGRKRKIVPPASQIGPLLLLGLVSGSALVFWWSGLSRLDPTFAAFLWRFAPVFTMLLGRFVMGDQWTPKELAPTGVMIAGGLLSTFGRWETMGAGAVLTLLGCAGASTQMMIAKMMTPRIDANLLVFYRCAAALVVIAVWALSTGNIDLAVTPSYWLAVVVGAFLGPCLGFQCVFRAYRTIDLSRFSMIFNLQPLFVLPMAWIAFRSTPDAQQFWGGAMILMGAVWLVSVSYRLGRMADGSQ